MPIRSVLDPLSPWSPAMSLIRTCVLSVVLVPTLAISAAEKMAPTKSNPPPVATSGSYLIDKTIPAYGVMSQVPYYTESRANALYYEIHQVLADVESHVMAGNASASAVDAKSKKKEVQKDAPVAAIGDARIGELLNHLVELDAHIAYRTYLEQWQIDNSFSDLSRATELLAMNGQVGGPTVEKVQGTKSKAKTEAAAVPKAEAPAAKPAAPVAAPEAPAPAAAPAAAPEAPAPAPAAAPEAPAAAPAAAEAPAPAAAPEAPAPAAAAPAELPAAEPPADK